MLEQISNPAKLKNKKIRNRAISSSKSKYTIHFIAIRNGVEVGFLSLDINPNIEQFILYEIFVPHCLRNKGYGSRLLLEVESMAKNRGYKIVVLNPEPFEGDYPKSNLIKWYKKNGYCITDLGTGELEKQII